MGSDGGEIGFVLSSGRAGKRAGKIGFVLSERKFDAERVRAAKKNK
jgi:hypothetical protein